MNDNKTLQYVQIKHLDEGKVEVQYRPNVKKLQRLLKSNHALQFSVQYDVERNEKGGEMEVKCHDFIHCNSFLVAPFFTPMAKLPFMINHYILLYLDY